jgi:hypothetical protein
MKRISILFLFSILILAFCFSNFNYKNDEIIEKWSPKNDVVAMPVLRNSRPTHVSNSQSPVPQRDEKFKVFLSSSVKVSVSGGSGSGTIFYYDPGENWAYVISCGHLWDGNKSYKDLLKNKQKAKIITWYPGASKIQDPKIYEAEVLFFSNTRGKDCSCLRFKPDWNPNCFPIAAADYKLKKGEKLNSLGCDGGGEVARYEVEFLERRGEDLITTKNSPRPGRSGGGLLTDSGWYVGICWGTSDVVTGNGIGYFTPLDSIHKVFIENEHEWILLLSEFSGKNIPVFDWKNPNKKFDLDFIPMPAKIPLLMHY